jgi:uncharacterized protein (TIGR02271 family)
MISTSNIEDLMGSNVLGKDGDKVGTVGQVYIDPDDGHATWVSVKTGLFGTSESFVPLDEANYSDGALHISYDKHFVKDAPRVDADGALSEAEEDTLYEYYGLGSGTTSGYVDTTTTAHTDTTTDYVAPSTTGTAAQDTSGPNTDDAMTRSEERLNVGTQKVSTGRARLRKYIVSENQTVTVPVTHEEVTLQREPITDANIGRATAGPDLSEEEVEVTLSEERVVVDKETVPVERIKLDKETVTENQTVTEEVRKEQVEFVDGDSTVTSADKDLR